MPICIDSNQQFSYNYRMDDRTREILVITQEECAEVIQEISKIFRFGIDNHHKSGVVHRHKLETEVGDLLAMIDLLYQFGVIDQTNVCSAIEAKNEKLKIWSNIFKEDSND